MPSSASSPTRRAESGQASVEWTALLLVLALALAAGGVAAANPAGLVNAVVGGMRRALCVATGSACAAPPLRACVVRTAGLGGRLGVDLALVSIGAGRSVLTEVRSDGTAAVSLVDDSDLAVAFGAGVEGHLAVGRALRVEVEASAGVELAARLSRRRTWEVADARAAARMVKRLARVAGEEAVRSVPILGGVIGGVADVAGLSTDLRPPDRTGLEGGIGATLGIELTGGSDVQAGLSTTLGGSVDRRTGTRTLAFRLEGEGAATLRAVVLDGPGVEREGTVALAVEYDRDGRPTSLSVTGSGLGAGILGVPEVPGIAAGEGRTAATSTLDLTAPEHRAAYDRLVRALAPRRAADLPGAARALAGALAADGRREVARYRDDATAYGGDGSVELGGRVGLGGEVERTSSALVDAWARPPGGVWERRLDCVEGDRT